MWNLIAIANTLKQILAVERQQLTELTTIRRLLSEPLTNSVEVQFTGVKMANNELVFNVGQTSQASIVPMLADGVTPSNGVVSNVVWNFNDPSATVIPNADGVTATCTGVAASNGPITGNVSCTVTDTDSVVSQWSQTFTITTNQVQQQQLTQSVVVQFSDPNAPVAKPVNE